MYSVRYVILPIIFVFAVFCMAASADIPDTLVSPAAVLEKELESRIVELRTEFPGLKGSLKLKVTVSSNGSVFLAETIDARLNDTEPVAEIIEKVYQWKFSQFDARHPGVTVIRPVRFGAAVDSTAVFFVIMGVVIAAAAALMIFNRT